MKIEYRGLAGMLWAIIVDAAGALAGVESDATGEYVAIVARYAGYSLHPASFPSTFSVGAATFALGLSPVPLSDVPCDMQDAARRLLQCFTPQVCPQCLNADCGYHDARYGTCARCVMANVMGPAVDRKALQKVGL